MDAPGSPIEALIVGAASYPTFFSLLIANIITESDKKLTPPINNHNQLVLLLTDNY